MSPVLVFIKRKMGDLKGIPLTAFKVAIINLLYVNTEYVHKTFFKTQTKLLQIVVLICIFHRFSVVKNRGCWIFFSVPCHIAFQLISGKFHWHS